MNLSSISILPTWSELLLLASDNHSTSWRFVITSKRAEQTRSHRPVGKTIADAIGQDFWRKSHSSESDYGSPIPKL